MPYSVTITSNNQPVDTASVTATAVLSGTAPVQITLADGGHGAYTGTFSGLTMPGTYDVFVEATGTSGGAPFALLQRSSFTIGAGTASLGSQYAEGTLTDAFGNYSTLLITPTVIVASSGANHQFSLTGRLVDPTGATVAEARAEGTLPAGTTQQLALAVDGQPIGATGRDGPYQLQDVILEDTTTAPGVLDDQAGSPYTTAAYKAAQFSKQPVAIGGTITDAGGNPTAAGLFQTLDVTTTVQVSATGVYTAGALLIDSFGAPITSTVQSVTLGTSATPVVLHFPGGAISAHGVNGPYQVVGFTVTAVDGTELADIDTLETTQPYQASQFAQAVQTAAVSAAPGWNLIDLPLTSTSPISASAILQGVLQNSGGNLAAIFALHNGQWSAPLLLQRGGQPTGTDFVLQPGVGYLLYCDQTGSYLQTGTLPPTQPTWTLTSGWNLVGLSLGATGPISGSTILQGTLQSSGGNLAAIFSLHNGRWSAPLLLQRGGQPTGTNFVLQPGQGYLLYIDTGTSYTPGVSAAVTLRGRPRGTIGNGATGTLPPGLPAP